MINLKKELHVNEIRYIIGKEYCETPKFDNEENEFVRLAFEEIKKVNKFLFEQIPFPVIFTNEDTYKTAKEMRKRVMQEGKIYIYTEFEGHPYLSKEENAIGRAVHDIFAHLVCGCPFDFQGEYNAFLEQSKYYPEWVFGVLFGEIPAQTSAYYYKGNFTYKQRAIEAPKKWIELTKGLKKDYSENSILKPFKHLYDSNFRSFVNDRQNYINNVL